jgi:DNA-binding transcriptional LysR family regulator
VALDPGTLVKLRAFEAVGRNLSFNRAATELAVTPTALSHHVRHLEDQLGHELFLRLHRQIVLTDTGRKLLAACTSGLTTLERAVNDATRGDRDTTLTVSVAPYFSARWLTPRLANFWAAHPEIELRLHHAYQPADFSLDRVDAGIAWGHGRWTGTHAVRVLTGELTALCSPDLRRAIPAKPKPADLARWKLFYEFDPHHWTRWFAAAGAKLPTNARTVRVDDSHALRKLAIESQGVALFFTGLSREDLRSGQLERPLDVTVDPGAAYYLTRPSVRPMSRPLALFWEWILDEVQLDPFA